MQADPRYDDVVTEVQAFLDARVEACVAAGIPRERLCIDPGIGFGKRAEHNLALLGHLDVLTSRRHTGAGRCFAQVADRYHHRPRDRRPAGGERGARGALRRARGGDRAGARRRGNGRCGEDGRCAARSGAAEELIVARKYFGTDGVRGPGRGVPDDRRFRAAAGQLGGARARPGGRARAGRKGHAPLGVHVRGGARGRLRRGWGGRQPDRAAADARRSLT